MLAPHDVLERPPLLDPRLPQAVELLQLDPETELFADAGLGGSGDGCVLDQPRELATEEGGVGAAVGGGESGPGGEGEGFCPTAEVMEVGARCGEGRGAEEERRPVVGRE